MRISHVFAAVLAATLTAAPALAETYRDAAPAMGQVAVPNAPRESAHGISTGAAVSPRYDRNHGDAAPVIQMNPNSVSRPGSTFGITSPEAGALGEHGHFTSPRFE